jgi:hypothetical protein
LLLLQGQAWAVQRIITSLTIKTISRGTKEMTRLVLTVQGCYCLSDIGMAVVELHWKSAGAGKHFAYWQKTRQTKFPTQKKEKIGPPSENSVMLIIKEENKTAGGTQYERIRFKIL